MRFVLVGPSAPLRGGIAIDNDALAQALFQAGHTVEQISFNRLYPAFLFPGRSQYDSTTAGAERARSCIDSINPLSWWRTAVASVFCALLHHHPGPLATSLPNRAAGLTLAQHTTA
jgi:hypothetical protein